MADSRKTLGPTTSGWPAKAAGLALVYFVCAKLSLLLAIPPGYSAPVWPAAGVALVGLLLFGSRLWPGVFAGSFLTTVSGSLDLTSVTAILGSVTLPTAIAAGAVLQALLGAYLIRRLGDFPIELERPSHILGAMALGGPLACLVSATAGVTSLYVLGQIEAAGFARNWGTWWFGDAIGVLLVLPLAFVWFNRLRPSWLWRIMVSLPVLAAVAVTVLGYLDTRSREAEAAQAEFDRRAEIMARTLERAVNSQFEIIQSIVSLFETRGEVSRTEFQAFVQPAFERHSEFHALEWVVIVSDDERAAFEQEVRESGFPDFQITERSADGRMVPAGVRDEYNVVFYVEPYEGNEEALGYDLASDPVRATALAQARDTGQIVATAPIVLVQETEQKPGFLFFAPIYERGLARHTPSQRRRNLDSFALGVFRADEMVGEAMKSFQGEEIEYAIADITQAEGDHVLFGHHVPTVELAGLAWSTDLEIAGRRWALQFRATPDYTSGASMGKAWLVLTGGMFLAGLLGAFLVVLAGGAAATERANRELRREIEDRQRAEAALRSREEYFRAVFDNAAVGVGIVKADRLIGTSNNALQRFLGYSGEELATKEFSDLTHPEDVEGSLKKFGELVAGHRSFYEEDKRWITKNGETVWGHITVSLVRDADDQPLYTIGMVQDITERKQAEQAAARFSDVLEGSINEIYIFDAETLRFVEVNRGARENLGYSLAELRDLTPLDLKPEFTPDSFAALIEPLRTGQRRIIEFTTVHLRKDGTLYPVEVHLQLMRTGEPVFLAIILDISERKERDKALRYTQFSVDRAADSIFWVEKDGSFSYVNQAACEMTGYARAELLSMNLFDIDATSSPETWARTWRAVQSEDHQVIESRMLREDGSSFPTEIAINYLEVDGVGRCFASARDITERKKAEEERIRLETKVQEAQKLESLGVLAGGIAHDFNNLLVGVLGNAELALARLPHTAPAYEYLQDIETSAQRAADLAKQLLAYSGKGKFVIQPTDLSELVDEIANLVEVAVSKKATVKYDLARDLPSIECDVTQIRQVVLNLITNASEAVGDRTGVISITTGQMDCDTAYLEDSWRGPLPSEDMREGTYVFVEVADTGSGMDGETRTRMFDPFFTTKFTGRGLGLAAVLGIVRGHEGAIRVYSEPGRGTTIKVLFPASAQSAARTRDVQKADETTWRGKGTILLVDDEQVVRQVAGRMLTMLGFGVVTAEDGVEALAIYRERVGEICLVLLDLAMPRMGGEEAFSALRRINKEVKVVLSSGYNEQDSTNKFAGRGLAGFIQKPYRLGALRQCIREVLGSPDGEVDALSSSDPG